MPASVLGKFGHGCVVVWKQGHAPFEMWLCGSKVTLLLKCGCVEARSRSF